MKYTFVTITLLFSAFSVLADTGRQLQFLGAPTGLRELPSQNFAAFLEQPVLAMKWDERCAAVEFTLNENTLPNQNTDKAITVEQLEMVARKAMQQWTDIPYSYVELSLTNVKDLGNRQRIAGDFLSEITFVTNDDFGPLARSNNTPLMMDTVFLAGEDLDGDGDNDVFDPQVVGLNTCIDLDGDGDMEFPAGEYKAGTIIDNDIEFNLNRMWELEPTAEGGVDLYAVMLHELGHSIGLNHSLVDRLSPEDSTSATMFPFIDTDDALAELANRSLEIDDMSAAGYLYPEGSADSGLAALQEGDVAFLQVFDLLEGSVRTGGADIVGAHVSAMSKDGEEAISSTYNGRVALYIDVFDVNQDGEMEIAVVPEAIQSSAFTLPVPKKSVYTASIQAVDGNPVPPSSVSVITVVADAVGLNRFSPEFFNGSKESDIEYRPSATVPFYSRGRFADAIHFETNQEIIVQSAQRVDFDSLDDEAVEELVYAQAFDRKIIESQLVAGASPISAGFLTTTVDSSFPTIYSSAKLALGRIVMGGQVEITEVLYEQSNLLARKNDYTLFYFDNPTGLPFRIAHAFRDDPSLTVFTILEADVVTRGSSGQVSQRVALELSERGDSFYARNGGPLMRIESIGYVASLNFVDDESPINPFLLNVFGTDVQ